MNKGTRVGEILEARRLLAGVGIRVGFFLQLGYPGRQSSTTPRHAPVGRGSATGRRRRQRLLSLPGTKFYDLRQGAARRQAPLAESNDLEMSFAGTFTLGFYRRVRNLLHDEVKQAGAPISSSARRELIETAKR
jgi:anaerobic magnesium-protoporphyrin IX monomethyl ester cyclase